MSRLLFAPMLLLATCLPALAAELTPGDIRAMLGAADAGSVMQKLDSGADSENAWFAVLDHMERGEADWLDLAPLLAPGTDAGTAEGLTITLSRALKTNPQAVLSLVAAGHYAATDICLDNDIEVSALEAAAFIDAALVSVAAVLDPAVFRARNACLHSLGRARIDALI